MSHMTVFGDFEGTSINLIYLSAMDGKLQLPAELDYPETLAAPQTSRCLIQFCIRNVSCT